MPTPMSHIGQHFSATHQNGTPLRYPRKSGGSPTGVRLPPTFDTMKIKKTTWCAVSRYLFILSHGRIKSIEAPVVPNRLAANAPTNRKITFTIGVASPFTL